MTVHFTIPAVPVAQPRQRHRVVEAHGRTFAQNYTPKNSPVNAFKASVRHELSQVYQGPPLEGPLELDVTFVLPRPGCLIWKKREMPRIFHATRGDVDNYCKAVLDALKGLLFRDDGQIAVCHARKFIAAGDEQPHAMVTATLLLGASGD